MACEGAADVDPWSASDPWHQRSDLKHGRKSFGNDGNGCYNKKHWGLHNSFAKCGTHGGHGKYVDTPSVAVPSASSALDGLSVAKELLGCAIAAGASRQVIAAASCALFRLLRTDAASHAAGPPIAPPRPDDQPAFLSRFATFALDVKERFSTALDHHAELHILLAMAKKSGRISAPTANVIQRLDNAYTQSRHIDLVKLNGILKQVSDELSQPKPSEDAANPGVVPACVSRPLDEDEALAKQLSGVLGQITPVIDDRITDASNKLVQLHAHGSEQLTDSIISEQSRTQSRRSEQISDLIVSPIAEIKQSQRELQVTVQALPSEIGAFRARLQQLDGDLIELSPGKGDGLPPAPVHSSVSCKLFLRGTCARGGKCAFSHQPVLWTGGEGETGSSCTEEDRLLHGEVAFARLAGLSQAHLNGVIGHVLGYSADKSRWQVRLHGSDDTELFKRASLISYVPLSSDACPCCQGEVNMHACPPCDCE